MPTTVKTFDQHQKEFASHLSQLLRVAAGDPVSNGHASVVWLQGKGYLDPNCQLTARGSIVCESVIGSWMSNRFC